jgi:DNA-binding transcriptional LysR family regulator
LNYYQIWIDYMLLADLEVVLKVAEFKSIKQAAESLNLQTATASAALKRAEQTLGVELFVRSTRQLRLSAAGERYIPNISQAMLMLEQIQQTAKADAGAVDGELRLSAPSDLGRNVVLPWLDELLKLHSGIRLKLHVSDSNVDFYRDPIDIALRYGKPKDSSLYGFKICDVPRVLCASPAYLAKHGSPTEPQQLAAHNGLFYQLHDLIYDEWDFFGKNGLVKVKMTGNRASNDAELVRRWCVAGHGLATKSMLDMAADLLNGTVVPVMPDFQPPSTELWLICPTRQLITPAVRLLREFLTIRCEQLLVELRQRQFFSLI